MSCYSTKSISIVQKMKNRKKKKIKQALSSNKKLVET